MVKRNKNNFNIPEIFENIERNSPVRVYVDRRIEDDCCGFFVEEDNVIVINPNQSDIAAVQTIVHEVAHFVDISENCKHGDDVFNAEIVARCVENIIVAKSPSHVVINAAVKWVCKNYRVIGAVKVDDDYIAEVVDRVRQIVGF